MWSRQNKTEESTTQETSEKTTEEKATDNTDTTQEEKNTLLFAEDTSETEDAVPEPWENFYRKNSMRRISQTGCLRIRDTVCWTLTRMEQRN